LKKKIKDFFLFISLLAQRNEAKKVHHESQPAFCLAHKLPTYTAQQNLGSRLSWTPAPDLLCTCLLNYLFVNKGDENLLSVQTL
jgi:hypothetical protein